MLNIKNKSNSAVQRFFALLFFISIITFHTNAVADIEETAESYRARGYEQQQKGNLYEAMTYYTKALAMGLESPHVFNDVGVLYEQVGRTSRAEEAYLKAIRLDKNYLPPYSNLAYLYKNSGFPQKAFEYFKLRYELAEPNDPWAQKAKEEMLAIRPQYKSWFQMIEAERLNEELTEEAHRKFVSNMERSSEHFEQGKELFKQGRYRRAIGEYNRALSYTPENPKIMEARRTAVLELSKQSVRERSEQAIKLLNSGDMFSARHEIERMLTIMPDESVLNSKN